MVKKSQQYSKVQSASCNLTPDLSAKVAGNEFCCCVTFPMRRSGAPSSLQVPACKKSRFQTPYISVQGNNVVCGGGGVSVNTNEVAGSVASTTQSKLQEILSKIRKPSNGSSHNVSSSSTLSPCTNPSSSVSVTSTESSHLTQLTVHKYTLPMPSGSHIIPSGSHTIPTGSHTVPSTHLVKDEGNQASGSAEGIVSNDGCGHRYYNVMWCKRSNKKHKTWQGDAIMVVQGSSVSLKDMDGRDIGKGLGYKKSELSGLTEGSMLIIGGKEIEVIEKVSEEDWKSGKCFTGDDTLGDAAMKSRSTLIKKKMNPFRSNQGPISLTPLFEAGAPGTLVMPRPSPKHQLEYNGKGLCVVDVVVDPHLSTHLRPHQREGVIFLYECLMGMKDYNGQGVILADEMGLGKTLQCITLIWTLIKQGPYGLRPVTKKVLIITPGSLVKNWEKEFSKWLGRERLKVYSVSGDNRAEGFVKSPLTPVLIISYEMFLRSQEILKTVDFDLIICDEGHRLKNALTKTTSVIYGLSSRRRILLTGTPIQNDLQEFYSIVDFCNPSILGSHAAFQRIYEGPIALSRQPRATPEEKEVGRARAEELKRLTSLFCLRRTQEVINKFLPPKVDNIVFCRMTNLQLSLYKHLLNSRLVKSCLCSGSYSSSNHQFPPHLVCIGVLKKLCNSPGLIYEGAVESGRGTAADDEYDQDTQESLYLDVLKLFPDGYGPHGEGVAESGCGKLIVLDEMLHQLLNRTREKVVVVSNYTQMLDILQKLCHNRCYGFLRLDGSTPSSKRQAIVEKFNSKHSTESVFLLSSKAGGVGLNLTGASRLILYDIDWNPANDLQAMARVWRDGQKKKVHIYRLLTTGSIEEKIFQRQITKQGLNAVMDFDGGANSSASNNDKKWSVNFTREELKDLFSLKECTLCDTHDLIGCGCGGVGRCGTDGAEHHNSVENSGREVLLQWQHYSHPINHTSLSDQLLIGRASSTISFVFQTETRNIE